MDEKYKKIFNKNMNNNNYFKYISNNVIQKNNYDFNLKIYTYIFLL